MTTLDNLREALPGYARDLQLNLGHGADERRARRA